MKIGKKKKITSMVGLTQGYEELLKGRKLIRMERIFEKVLKKAATPKPKQRGSKKSQTLCSACACAFI